MTFALLDEGHSSNVFDFENEIKEREKWESEKKNVELINQVNSTVMLKIAQPQNFQIIINNLNSIYSLCYFFLASICAIKFL